MKNNEYKISKYWKTVPCWVVKYDGTEEMANYLMENFDGLDMEDGVLGFGDYRQFLKIKKDDYLLFNQKGFLEEAYRFPRNPIIMTDYNGEAYIPKPLYEKMMDLWKEHKLKEQEKKINERYEKEVK